MTVPVTGPVVIGRSPGADIVIGDDFVSAQPRAGLARPATTRSLEDLGSTNGTLLNGQPLVRPHHAAPRRHDRHRQPSR